MHRLLDVLMLSAAVALAGQSSTVFAQQTSTVEVNSVTLNYIDEGEGRPVLLVPAAIVDHRAWEPNREAIAREHRFIAYT